MVSERILGGILGINIDALLTANSRKSARTTARMTVRTTWKSTGISLDHNLSGYPPDRIAHHMDSTTDNRMYLHVAAINYLPSATLCLSESTTCKRPRAVRVLIHHHDIHTVSVQIHWEQFLSQSQCTHSCVRSLLETVNPQRNRLS